MKKDLDYWLENISVCQVDSEHIDLNYLQGLENWWFVSNEDGVIAYFGNEKDAFRFRLDYINRKLNP